MDRWLPGTIQANKQVAIQAATHLGVRYSYGRLAAPLPAAFNAYAIKRYCMLPWYAPDWNVRATCSSTVEWVLAGRQRGREVRQESMPAAGLTTRQLPSPPLQIRLCT